MPKKKSTATAIIDVTPDQILEGITPELCLALVKCANSTNPGDELWDALVDRGLLEPGTLMLTDIGNEVLDAIIEKYCTVTTDYSFERCDLTDAEMVDYGRRVATAHNQKRQHEAELHAYKDQMKAQVSRCDSEINSLSTALTNGYEVRRVEVQVTIDRLEGRYVKTRMDTGEIIASRPLDPFEKQLQIPGTDSAPGNN